MQKSGARVVLGRAGVAVACGVICCTMPLLAVALPGAGFRVGWAAESLAFGFVVAAVLAVLTTAGLLLRKRGRSASCVDGCDCGQPATLSASPAGARSPS